MDRGTLFLVVACQAVALAALLHRGGWDWATLKATGRRLSLYPRLYGAMGGNAWRCCGLAGHSEVLIVGQRVLAGDGEEAPAAVHVSNGTIVGVYPFNGTRNMEDLPASTRSAAVFNYGGAVVAPGIIDVHVHLNMPGREDWEGMVSGTRAAAAGGVTTVVDMPLNSHPCTTEGPLLKQKLGLAKARSVVNTGFWGGLVPENAADRVTLEALLESGAFGLKAFMSPSGINDFPNVSRHHIESAIPLLKERGMPLFVHAESVSHVHVPEGDPRAYSQYMASRPPKFESDAISTLIDVLNSSTHESKAGFRIHIAHLADANSLAMIQDAKSYGLPLTVETCPHYLSFWAEGIPDGATQYKCAPPLRDSANAIRLWDAVASGTIDMLSSDHSPAPPGMKHLDNGDFGKAWGGISGLQYTLPAVLGGASKRKLSMRKVFSLLSEHPAEMLGMANRKGKIAAGMDADIVVWDPDANADTSERGCYHRHKVSPYIGREMKGRVLATWVKGQLVFDEHKGATRMACGEQLTRQL